ncbi:MAG TPA: hypothetical protein VND93_30725 [Myxococcales bacterium]|nr:hypothetical protein [Myxococcales bacterium]
MSEGRRVRSVRLRAATPALVQRGALLLEDALRTASLPDPGPGRVLFIRKLALGVIRPDRSPSSLALALEQRVRALASDAVHAESDGAASAGAVYFADAFQALVALGTRLGRQQPLRAWFWPLVVPEAWGKPRDQALREVLAAALGTELGPAGAVALVGGLQARGAAGPLLGALRWVDGPSLARASWGYVPEVPRGVLLARAPSEELEALPPRARALAREWVEQWGPEDARSVWLAAVVMSLGRPARVAEPELPAKAVKLVAAMAAEARRKPRPALEERRPVVPREGPEAPAERPPLRAVRPPEPEPPVEEREAPPAEVPPPGPHARAPASAEEPPRAARPAPEEDVGEPGPPPEPAAPEVEDEWSETPEPTRAGGLLFLVHVLGYLGLPQLLAAQPRLQERGVAEHFLLFVAARLRVSPADPVLRAIRTRPLPPLAEPCEWELPELFRRRAGAAEPWRGRELPGGRALELDARGRMVLAVRRAGAAPTGPGAGVPAPALTTEVRAPGVVPESREGTPDVVPSTVQARASGTAPESPEGTPDLALLLRTIHLAVARVLRTRAKISLRRLVLRPARVAWTPTHLDVLLDHRMAELRIRRAGLDIDPGWVPWLGRVIRYHYLHGELPPD